MRFNFCILILALTSIFARAGNFVLLPNKEVPVKFLENRKQYYLLTGKNLYLKRNNDWLKIKNADTTIQYNTALALRDTLWLGSSKGLFAFKAEMEEIKAVFIDSLHRQAAVTGLATDAESHLWVSLFNKGAYRKFGPKFELLLDVNSTSAVSATPEGDIWIGSDIGLYQYNLRSNSWARYAEEGVSGSGLEIPDNIIECLFSDSYSNTWVLMPDYFTLISGEKGREHLSFGGRVLNHIETVSSIFALDAKIFVFFSGNGLLAYMSPLAEHPNSNEVHAAKNQKLIQLNAINLIDNTQKNETFLFISNNGKENCCLVSNKAVYFLKKNKIKARISKQIRCNVIENSL